MPFLSRSVKKSSKNEKYNLFKKEINVFIIVFVFLKSLFPYSEAMRTVRNLWKCDALLTMKPASDFV